MTPEQVSGLAVRLREIQDELVQLAEAHEDDVPLWSALWQARHQLDLIIVAAERTTP